MSSTSTPKSSTSDASPTVIELLTPPGAGAIAVIRVSGPRAEATVRPFLHGAHGPLSPLAPDRIRKASFRDSGETLDEVLVVKGEGMLDVCAIGGVRVVERIIAALARAGGKFTALDDIRRPAWPVANRVDAEVCRALAAASTRRAVRFLMGLRHRLPAALKRIAELARRDAPGARTVIQALLTASPSCRCLIEGFTVAIVGPPNAGKSTLANRLVGAQRALVSPRAGTTLDWLEEQAAIQGVAVTIVDTPGYGQETGPLEREASERAAGVAQRAHVRLLVFDGSIPPPEFRGRVTPSLSPDPSQAPTLLVLNKRDLGRAWSDSAVAAEGAVECVELSALDGTGHGLLENHILAKVGLAGSDHDLIGLFTSRQCGIAQNLLKEDHGGRIAEVIWADLMGPPGENKSWSADYNTE